MLPAATRTRTARGERVADEDVSIAELVRTVKALRADMRERFTEQRTDMSDRFDQMDRRLSDVVPRGEHDREVRRLDGRIDDNAEDIRDVRTDQATDRHVARQGRQWAIATAVAVAATFAAYLTLWRSSETGQTLGAIMSAITLLSG